MKICTEIFRKNVPCNLMETKIIPECTWENFSKTRENRITIEKKF